MYFVADTSVWISHFNKYDHQFVELLNKNRVLMHPVVLGEIMSGNIKNREETLLLMNLLPRSREATHSECYELIERLKLNGVGLSYSDIQILGGALLSSAALLTKDKAMSKIVAMTMR